MFEQILEEIKKADSIVIAGHIRPDGDCYGSQVGLKDAIVSTFPEKKVYLVGSGLPNFFDFFEPTVEVDDETIKNSLCIIVDLNELYRIEDQRIRNLATKMILFDHHVKMEIFPFPTAIDSDACSVSELIIRFVQEQNLKLSPKGANALYLGVLTDSAQFQYVANFPRVFALCKYLCEIGARPELVNQRLAETNENTLRAKGYALTHYHKKNGGIIYLHMNHLELRKLGIQTSYGTTLINHIGNLNGYPIWATFFEDREHTCLCEFRSSKYNVCSVAMKYGGGGHMMAAGLTVKNFNKRKMNNILNDLLALIKEDQ